MKRCSALSGMVVPKVNEVLQEGEYDDSRETDISEDRG